MSLSNDRIALLANLPFLFVLAESELENLSGALKDADVDGAARALRAVEQCRTILSASFARLEPALSDAVERHGNKTVAAAS